MKNPAKFPVETADRTCGGRNHMLRDESNTEILFVRSLKDLAWGRSGHITQCQLKVARRLNSRLVMCQ